MKNYFDEETNEIRKLLNLEEILKFQLNHKIEIIRGEDLQYICYIDNKEYCTALTPLGTLMYGITKYKDSNYENK